MRLSNLLLVLLVLSLIASVPAVSRGAGEISSRRQKFRVETVVEGLQNPWSLAKLPDGRFLVTERAGRLRVIADGKLVEVPVVGVPLVWAKGQGGLFDVVLHPDYKSSGWIYLSYSKSVDGKSLTAVIRARLKDNRLVDIETIFDPPDDELNSAGAHFGGRLAFDNRGCIFFSIGDRGDVTTPANRAQRTDTVRGKIHRLHDDGRVPEDNPFVKTPGAKPSIWCFGNRNPQALAFRPGTQELWETEHGPRGGDELNHIKPGLNYGWPVVTFGINYNGTPITDKTTAPGFESPVEHWAPSPALSGMSFLTGDKLPGWKGDVFLGALAGQKLIRVRLDGDTVVEQENLLQGSGRVRDVREFDDGFLYVVYDSPGKIVRLVPAE